jgi:phosphate transport system permease protein
MLAALLVALCAWPGAAAAVDRPTLKIDPPTQTVSPGQTFVLNVLQSSPVALTGAQANIIFDPKLVQLSSFELGPSYTAAGAVFAFGNADQGTSGNMDATVKRANETGVLENAAGFLLPGSGTIAAGDLVFLKVTFIARAGANGQVTVWMSKTSMIDEGGDAILPHLVFAVVGVAPGGGGASSSPGASSDASPSPAQPSATAAATGPTPAPSSPSTPVRVSLAPTSLTLLAGNTARVFLIANAAGDISSAVADLTFDASKLEILGVDLGPSWGGAVPIAVATDKAKRGIAVAIAEANTTGVLQAVGAFFAPGAQPLPYGEGVFVSVLVKAKADGTSNLSIGNADALGVAGEKVPVTLEVASLTKPPDKGLQLDPTLVIPILVLLLLVAVGVVLVKSGRIPVRVQRRWPYYVSMALGLVPVALFLAMLVMLAANAAPALKDPGIGALFGGTFRDNSGNPSMGYSILPALWGTILITFIAVAVALPTSLVLAVAAVDFPMGVVGRLVRPLIGVLSGVPPIVYAVSVPGFVVAIMIPKFAAGMTYDQFAKGGPAFIGADPSSWPPHDVPYSPGGFPWEYLGGNSALLGGLLVGLFLIPFITPLIVDALSNVPRAAREASLALGANRTYTLRRVVLPRALPSIAGASMLAVLKAMGDAVILLFAVGISGTIPTPPFDALERASGIGAWGASLIGSFEILDQSCLPRQCAVGYSSALALMAFAAVAVIVMSYLQARGRRRVAV